MRQGHLEVAHAADGVVERLLQRADVGLRERGRESETRKFDFAFWSGGFSPDAGDTHLFLGQVFLDALVRTLAYERAPASRRLVGSARALSLIHI